MRSVIVGLAMLLLAVGCPRTAPKKEYIARVGDSYLTKEDVAEIRSGYDTVSDAQVHDYVTRWVIDEVLYSEALKRGLERNPTIQHRFEEAHRELLIQQLLQDEIYSDSIVVPEDSIRAYYGRHTTDFRLPEDVIKLRYVIFNSRDNANAFRTRILKGTPWESGVQDFARDTSYAASIMAQAEARTYTQQTLYPSEIWRVALTLGANEVSFPVRTTEGFYVVQTLSVLKQGERASIDMVRDEIYERLIQGYRRRKYAELVSRLRSKYPIHIALPIASGVDSTRAEE